MVACTRDLFPSGPTLEARFVPPNMLGVRVNRHVLVAFVDSRKEQVGDVTCGESKEVLGTETSSSRCDDLIYVPCAGVPFGEVGERIRAIGSVRESSTRGRNNPTDHFKESIVPRNHACCSCS